MSDVNSERESLDRMWEPNSRVNTAVHYVLSGEDPGMRKGRRFREMLPATPVARTAVHLSMDLRVEPCACAAADATTAIPSLVTSHSTR